MGPDRSWPATGTPRICLAARQGRARGSGELAHALRGLCGAIHAFRHGWPAGAPAWAQGLPEQELNQAFEPRYL